MYAYRIEPQGPGEPSDVSQSWLDRTLEDVLDQATTVQKYPIVVYDEDEDTYHRGILVLSE